MHGIIRYLNPGWSQYKCYVLIYDKPTGSKPTTSNTCISKLLSGGDGVRLLAVIGVLAILFMPTVYIYVVYFE